MSTPRERPLALREAALCRSTMASLRSSSGVQALLPPLDLWQTDRAEGERERAGDDAADVPR